MSIVFVISFGCAVFSGAKYEATPKTPGRGTPGGSEGKWFPSTAGIITFAVMRLILRH